MTTVNNLVTVTSGKRLERFIKERWGRSDGGIRGLASQLHVAPDQIYKWFNEKAAPDTDQLRELARLLKVTRVEIVAAMDAVPADPAEAMVRRIVREEAAAYLADQTAQGNLTILPGGRPSRPRGRAPR